MIQNVRVQAIRAGRVVYDHRISNRVLNSGITATVQLLGNAGGTPNIISVGTGTTPVNDGDVQLENEVLRNRVTRAYGLPSTAVYQLLILDTQANDFTLSECGLWVGARGDYSTAAAGITDTTAVLFARALIPPFPKTSADTLVLTWEIPIVSVKS